VVLYRGEIAVDASLPGEGDDDEPVDAAREDLRGPARVQRRRGVAGLGREQRGAAEALHGRGEAVGATARGAVRGVVAADAVALERGLPVQVVRDLVREGAGPGRGRQVDGAARGGVERER